MAKGKKQDEQMNGKERRTEIHFFLPMRLPNVTHQEQKVAIRAGRPVFYFPPELRAAQGKFLSALAPYRPEEPLAGPVRLMVKWCYRANDQHPPGWKTTKPDTDNLIKLFKDCLTKTGFFHDDAQVASEINEKFYDAHEGIFVRMEVL